MNLHDSLAVAGAFALVFVLAGFVKGLIGLGLPTVAMALLVLLTTPARAAALLLVPALLTNVWQLRPWPSLRTLLRPLVPLQLGIVAGTLLGALAFGAPDTHALRALGATLIAYAAWGLAARRFIIPQRHRAGLGLVAGLLTGVVTAVTGVFVIPALAYLQALDLSRPHLLQAMGLSFTTSTLTLFAVLLASGHAPPGDLGLSALLLGPALCGMSLGQILQRRFSQTLFRKLLYAALALLGVHLLLR